MSDSDDSDDDVLLLDEDEELPCLLGSSTDVLPELHNAFPPEEARAASEPATPAESAAEPRLPGSSSVSGAAGVDQEHDSAGAGPCEPPADVAMADADAAPPPGEPGA
eukprot:6657182-Prymnesium_polylepis.1